MNSLIRASLFILGQIFFDQLIERLCRHASVAPQMKTECADSTEHGHDNEHQNPDGDGKVLNVWRRRTANVAVISEAGGTGKRLRYRTTKQNERNENRLHVIKRSRFIFR